MPSAFLSNDFKNTIVELRKETIEELKKRFSFYHDDWHRMGETARAYAENDMQLDVIDFLKEKYTPEVIEQVVYQAQQWVASKEGIIRQFLRSTEKETEERLTASKIKFVKQRYVKVIVKCNSDGGDEVKLEDLDSWVDSLEKQVLSMEHKKYLKKSKDKVKNNLVKMLAFPVSMKETNVDDYVSEVEFLKDMDTEGIYFPDSAKNIDDLSSKLLVTLNGVRYLTPKPKGELIEETEGRLKTNECDKMGKYTAGGRAFPHHDGVGFKKKVQNITDISDACKSVINVALKGEVPDVSYRFMGLKSEGKYGKFFPYSIDFLKEAKQSAEDSLMYVLKDPYVDGKGNVSKSIKNNVGNLIMGVWIDMKEKVSKAPVEVQLKDSFADLIYRYYSPIGHNSKDYDDRRNEKCKTTLSVVNPLSGKKEQITLSTQLILDYQVGEILRPAFTTMQF